MAHYRRRRRQAANLQPKFMGPYFKVKAMPDHTYNVECSGQASIQNEACLKLYWASPDVVEKASPLLKPRRQTATQGWLRYEPEYEVVVPQDRNVVRNNQPPLPTEKRLPLPSPTPVPSPTVPNSGQEVGSSPGERFHVERQGRSQC